MDKETIRQGRKFFSKLGLMFFLGTILIYGVQFGVELLAYFYKPEWLMNIDTYMIISMVPMYLVGMPLLMLLLTRVPVTKLQPKKMSFGALLVAIMMSYSIMYVSNWFGTAINYVVELIKDRPVTNNIEMVATSLNPLLSMLFMVICAPVMEELIFRKMLVERAVRYGEGVAIVVSGLMFGLFHGNLSQFVYATLLGMFLAFVFVKTGRIRYTIIIHMVVNFIGGVLAPLLLNMLNDSEMIALLQSEDIKTMLRSVLWALKGISLLLGYVVLLLGMVIAGVVLLIVFRKKFKLTPKGICLPKGKRFTTVFLNLGMLLFSLFWIMMIVLQLFDISLF